MNINKTWKSQYLSFLVVFLLLWLISKLVFKPSQSEQAQQHELSITATSKLKGNTTEALPSELAAGNITRGRVNAPRQQISSREQPLMGSLPSLPAILKMTPSYSEDSIRALSFKLPEINKSLAAGYKQYTWKGNRSDAELESAFQKLFTAYDKDDISALLVLSATHRSCKRSAERVHCQLINDWKQSKAALAQSVSVFDRIDALAQNGNLHAQYRYLQAMYDALEAKEMNPAIDSQLWLERRQRLINYLFKFSKAGDEQTLILLGMTLSDNLIIEAKPFWAAVVFSQAKYLYALDYGQLDELIELHDLQVRQLEVARVKLFGPG